MKAPPWGAVQFFGDQTKRESGGVCFQRCINSFSSGCNLGRGFCPSEPCVILGKSDSHFWRGSGGGFPSLFQPSGEKFIKRHDHSFFGFGLKIVCFFNRSANRKVRGRDFGSAWR